MKFKVGDWIVPIGKDAVRGTIKQFSRSMEIEQMSHPKHYQQFFKLWKPKEGEWCWFRSKSMPKHIQVLAQFKDFSKDDTMAGLYTVIFDKNDVEEGTMSIHYDECEPFIGQLPTFVSDKQ